MVFSASKAQFLDDPQTLILVCGNYTYKGYSFEKFREVPYFDNICKTCQTTYYLTSDPSTTITHTRRRYFDLISNKFVIAHTYFFLMKSVFSYDMELSSVQKNYEYDEESKIYFRKVLSIDYRNTYSEYTRLAIGRIFESPCDVRIKPIIWADRKHKNEVLIGFEVIYIFETDNRYVK